MNTAFLAFANNYNNRLPNLKEESDQVYKILFDNNKNDFNIVREEFAHSSTVIDKIRRIDKKLKVFLFSGHANSEKLLMDADSAIYIEGFAPILPPNIPLVILNGCSTAGKVTSLIEAGAKVVIATSSAISDRKATDFSITFFEQFVGNKKSIKDSFDDAIKVTQVKNGQISERIDRGALNSNYRNSKNAHLPVWGLYYNKENEGYIQEKFADVIKPEFSYLKNKKFIYGLLLVLIGLGYWLLTSLNSPDTRLETRDIFTYLSLYKNNVKVEEYKFENINPFKNNLTNKNFEVATKDSLYYLVNKGLKVDDKPYNFLFPCNNGWFLAIKDTFYTYLNENGKEFTDWYDKELVDVGWISFSNFNNKGFCVRKNNKWGIFDNKGKVLLPFEYDEPIINLRNASEPLEIQKNGLIGLIDSTGKIIVQPQYSRMEGYYNGYVQVLKNGKWDLIDINGKERSAPIYDSLLVNRYFKFAKYGSKWGIIDRDVRNYKINDISLNGHFAQVKVNTQWGIVDSNLKPLIEPQLDFIDEIKSSFIVGKSKNKWQVFNTKGERISSELDSTERYDIDFLWVKKNGKWGEIDTNGIFTLMPTLSDKEQGEKRGRRGDNNSFFEVQIGEKHGAKNKEGKIVVPVTYDGVDVNSNYSYIKVRKGDLFGFYYNPDSYDFVKCEPQYDEIEGSKSSHINFRKGNKWGLISIVKSFNYSDRAEITIPAMYDKQFEFTEDNCRSNWARVSKDGKSFYIDEKNNRVFSTTDFDDCKRITQNLIAIRKDLKWGFINCEGNIVIEKFFDEVEGFTVRKGNKWGMIDEKGNFLIAPQFQEISGNGGDGMLTVDKDNVKNLHINLQGEIILRH